jgi:hypothetical protein
MMTYPGSVFTTDDGDVWCCERCYTLARDGRCPETKEG